MGRAAVVTRDEDADTGRLGRALRERGVPVLHWPVTSILPPDDDGALRALAGKAASYDWVVFTSRNGVEAVAGVVGPAPEGVQVAVVGDKTAEAARDAGWPPDLVGDGTGEELARTLARRLGRTSAWILVPTTPRAADTVPRILRDALHRVDRVEAYRTGLAELEVPVCRKAIDDGAVGVVTFTSPSAVEGLGRALPDELVVRLAREAPAVAIGPTTAEAAREAGWRVAQADETSLEGVARRAVALLGDPDEGEDR